MTRPKISVLMPVYNAELFLADAIESIVNQSFSDFELIIVDDGSKDNSLSIAKQYCNADSRITVYTQKNMGISKTRNNLIALAHCDYIAWMDSDDISVTDRLDSQYKCLENDDELVAVGCGTLLIDDESMNICHWAAPITHEDIDSWHINGRGGAIIFASSMMRKQVVQDVGGFDLTVTGAEDLCLFLRLAEVGKIQNTSDILYHYRQHVDSISHAKKLKISKDKQLVLDNAGVRRGVKIKQYNLDQQEVSILDTYIKWGWWSLNGKNLPTSRKYAKKALLIRPFNLHAWKLFACSIRGY